MDTFSDFARAVTKQGEKGVRHHKATGSWGLHDAYLHIRKQGWPGIGHTLAERDFSSIVKTVNGLMAEELEKGNSITFPNRMGVLELRRKENKAVIRDGAVHIGYPVDWAATLKLWYADRKAMGEKRLLRRTGKARYRICYRKYPASYANRSLYEFLPNRQLVRKLLHNINEGKADTLW